jgi:hypothetical protein
MPRAALFLALALAACTQAPPQALPRAPAQPGAPATNPAVVAACREQVSRQLVRQDRGQLLREEERDARLGSDVTGARLPIDPLGRSTQFGRMVDECVRANTLPGPAARPGS